MVGSLVPASPLLHEGGSCHISHTTLRHPPSPLSPVPFQALHIHILLSPRQASMDCHCNLCTTCPHMSGVLGPSHTCISFPLLCGSPPSAHSVSPCSFDQSAFELSSQLFSFAVPCFLAIAFSPHQIVASVLWYTQQGRHWWWHLLMVELPMRN